MFLFLFLFLPHSTGKNLYKLTSLPCFLLWKLQINSCVSPCAGVNEMWPPMRERVSLWGWRGCTGDDGVALGWSWWLWSWLYLQAWISPVINYFFFVLCPLYCYLISSYANVFIGLLVFVISCLPFFFCFCFGGLVGQLWLILQSPEWQVLQLIVIYFVFVLFCNHNISLNLGLYLHLLYLVHWVI